MTGRQGTRLRINPGEVLHSDNNSYQIVRMIGEGCFGVVVRCIDQRTQKQVAIKMLKKESNAEREIKMLKILEVLDHEKTNIVPFIAMFTDVHGRTCLVFEMLDMDLLSLNYTSPILTLSEIRPIVHQLLTALAALKGIGVIHSDLKQENVMLVNHKDQPFKVKLIDFGVALQNSEAVKYIGGLLQPLAYRSPEIFMGLPFSEAIDMWSLGILLVDLYINKRLFNGMNEFEQISSIVKLLGMPPVHMLINGSLTKRFFKKDCTNQWKIYYWIMSRATLNSLDDLITFHQATDELSELEDRKAFVSFLKRILVIDPENRLTPAEGLQHPFLTMSHLQKHRDTSLYVKDCIDKMSVCRMDEEKSIPEKPPSDEAPSAKKKKNRLRKMCTFFDRVKTFFFGKRNKVSPECTLLGSQS